MGRPRATAEQLKLAGAQPSKIRARLAEEQGQLGVPDATTEQRRRWLPYLKEAIVKEKSTFASRIVAGKTVCLELGGVPFNWRTEHPLTMARKYASYLVGIPETRAPLPILREACAGFLEDLKGDHERAVVVDPVAADLLELMFNAFDRRDWICKELAIFDFVQYVAWKNLDGTRRYSQEDRESYTHRNILEEALKLSDQIV